MKGPFAHIQIPSKGSSNFLMPTMIVRRCTLHPKTLSDETPQTLRSVSQGLLDTPDSRTVIGARRFPSAAVFICNNLPFTV